MSNNSRADRAFPVPRLMLRLWVGLVCSLLIWPTLAWGFETGKLSFTMNIDGLHSSYKDFFTTAMPNGPVALSVESGAAAGEVEVSSHGSRLASAKPGTWNWTAPQASGLTTLEVRRRGGGERMLVHVFVLVPAGEVRNGQLNGYSIGAYPRTPYKGLASYKPPRGFIEVTLENKDTRISPHFTLEQFLCKQEGGYPKYVVLRPRLLLKLEGLLEEVNLQGIGTDGFVVMSGYRTPHYNASIGNVKNSRHVYGGAADIYIDVKPKDGRMDDLNGDGRITKADAMTLYRWVDSYVKKHRKPELAAGVGAYGANAYHGPFIHVDVRGEPARWGTEQ